MVLQVLLKADDIDEMKMVGRGRGGAEKKAEALVLTRSGKTAGLTEK